MNYLPGSDHPDIRDYLYIDRPRVGSLLAQFSQGLPEGKTEEVSRSSKLETGIRNFFTLGSEGEKSEARSLALADLHVSQLEENAEAFGLLADISDQILKRKHWLRGKVRKSIRPGMIVRVTALTQISDISGIMESFTRLQKLADDDRVEEIKEMVDQVRALYGDSITVSIRSVHQNEYETAFVGEIPKDHGFGPLSSELILSQIGPDPVELTTVFQIAAVPSEKDSKRSLEQAMGEINNLSEKFENINRLDRPIIDRFLINLGKILAASGFVAAPCWPAISMVPLAIYRNVEAINFEGEG